MKNTKNVLLEKLGGLMIYIAFFVLYLIFAFTLKDVGLGFSSMGNLMNIIRQTSLIAIIAVGMSFVLATANIDLSVGSLVGVVSLVTALVIKKYGIPLGILAGLSVGVVAGCINGFLITKIKIPAFIATLGTMIIFSGLSRTMTNLKSIPITSKIFKFSFGGGEFNSIPILLIWMIIIVMIGHIIMTKGSFGRKTLATGGNPRAATYSGINVNKVIFKSMLVCSTLAAFAGILWAGRFGGGRYSLGDGEEFSVIAAAILGGCSIYGGKATVLGACIGAVMIGMINNALIMYGLGVYQQMMVRGIVIILAVTITTMSEGRDKT